MAFSGSDVLDIAQIYLRLDVADAEAVKVLNLGSNQLGNLGVVYGEAVIDYVQGTEEWEDLPDGNLGVIFVADSNDKLYYRWQVKNNEIRFADDDEYKVSCRRLPDDISVIGDTVDLPDIYKSCLVHYVVGFSKLKDDDHSHDGIRMMTEFERAGVNAFNTMIKARKPTQVRVFRHG